MQQEHEPAAEPPPKRHRTTRETAVHDGQEMEHVVIEDADHRQATITTHSSSVNPGEGNTLGTAICHIAVHSNRTQPVNFDTVAQMTVGTETHQGAPVNVILPDRVPLGLYGDGVPYGRPARRPEQRDQANQKRAERE